MADEVKNEEAAAKGNPIIRLVLAAGAGGFATWLFVLAPMLASPDDEEGVAEAAEPSIPLNPVMFAFEDAFVNVIMDAELPASTLVYGVTFECANQQTVALITTHKARFVDMLLKLHSGLHRKDLDAPTLIQESIQRQAIQKANDILRRLGADPAQIRVTAVFHHSFLVDDKL
jgi:flagellar basal body-associated protein FliL